MKIPSTNIHFYLKNANNEPKTQTPSYANVIEHNLQQPNKASCIAKTRWNVGFGVFTKNVPMPSPTVRAIDRLKFPQAGDMASRVNGILLLAEREPDPASPSRAHDRGTILHVAAAAYRNPVQPTGLMSGLLGLNRFPVDAQDKYQQTALHVAAKLGAAEAVTALVGLDTHYTFLDLRDSLGKTAFELALATGAAGSAAREAFYALPGGLYDAWKPTQVRTMLQGPNPHPNQLQFQLNARQFDVNYRFPDAAGDTLFHIAAKQYDIASGNQSPGGLIRAILEHPGVDPNVRNNAGETALHCAAKTGSEAAIMEILLNERARAVLQAVDNTGKSVLHCAAGANAPGALNRLLTVPELTPLLRAQDGEGRTPLHYAAMAASEACARSLLARPDIGLTVTDSAGRMAVHYAAASPNGAAFGAFERFPEKVDFNAQDGHRMTPLHHAMRTGSLDAVVGLLTHGENSLPALDVNGMRPLDHALHSNRADVLDAATVNRKGWDALNSIDQNGRTLLHRAAMYEGTSPEVWGILLKHLKPKLSINDKTGRTALYYAAVSPNATHIDSMLNNAQFSLNTRDYEGRTILHHAAQSGHSAVVERLLLDETIDIFLKDHQGRTAYDLALLRRDVDASLIVNLLFGEEKRRPHQSRPSGPSGPSYGAGRPQPQPTASGSGAGPSTSAGGPRPQSPISSEADFKDATWWEANEGAKALGFQPGQVVTAAAARKTAMKIFTENHPDKNLGASEEQKATRLETTQKAAAAKTTIEQYLGQWQTQLDADHKEQGRSGIPPEASFVVE
ncbi:ankyrin repeat domain-containing protein [Noviherbaspirillum aerium]|uniref:ankyrin repeat domain-containing protein n=1 Tax=Noviherbaspirillum aerium TaxID=2588497 RepID=UPI00178C22E8|nr:ankyrin repeat domain-containing protein [Noviherbaspirillum aerium]